MYGQAAPSAYKYPPTIEYSKWRRNTICGLAASTFWLLLALIIVVVAAAVGGGVGGSLAVNNAKTSCLQSNAYSAQAQPASSATTSTSSASLSSSATSTTPSSSSAASTAVATTAWGPLQTTLPYTGCTANNNTIYTSVLDPSSKFQILCGLDIPYTGSSDLIYAVTPTYELCMEMCASWNDLGKSNGNATVPCKGIAFIPTHVNGDGSGNPIDCVLKSYATGLAPNSQYTVDSAILLSS
jgi:hypothetical protein